MEQNLEHKYDLVDDILLFRVAKAGEDEPTSLRSALWQLTGRVYNQGRRVQTNHKLRVRLQFAKAAARLAAEQKEV